MYTIRTKKSLFGFYNYPLQNHVSPPHETGNHPVSFLFQSFSQPHGYTDSSFIQVGGLLI